MNATRIPIRPGVDLDQALHGVWQGPVFVPLPARTYRLLAYLAEHPNYVIPIAALLRVGWPDEIRSADDLYPQIRHIRRVIEPDPHRPRWLVTRRSDGYVLRREGGG